MPNINILKKLRQETGVSLALCQKSLKEAENDIEKAKELLRKWGQDLAGKREGRATNQGIIESYIHPNKRIGVLVELRCETDFVAKNETFQELAHNLALHIAATNPLCVSEQDIPEEKLAKEKEIYLEQAQLEKKPKEIIEKIVEGKIEKYKKEACLLSQQYIKNSDITIQDLLNEAIAKTGENISIGNFARLEI